MGHKNRVEVTADRKKVRPSQLRVQCVCVCMCMLIDSLILSYNSNSNQVTHLFLLSCEVLMSPYDLKAWTISSNPFVEDLFLEIASELV